MPTTTPCPKAAHLYGFWTLAGMVMPTFPGQIDLMLDLPFREEILPAVQPVPPLVLEAVSLSWGNWGQLVTVHLGDFFSAKTRNREEKRNPLPWWKLGLRHWVQTGPFLSYEKSLKHSSSESFGKKNSHWKKQGFQPKTRIIFPRAGQCQCLL